MYYFYLNVTERLRDYKINLLYLLLVSIGKSTLGGLTEVLKRSTIVFQIDPIVYIKNCDKFSNLINVAFPIGKD